MRAICHADILDIEADALIYSTNVLLNCTGGVGGALMARYGSHVQEELHLLLAQRGSRFAAQGEVFDLVPQGLPYRHLLHTIPCDGMYDTSVQIVESVLRHSLDICASDARVQTVAVSALATGYGHLPFDAFVPLADRVICDAIYQKIPRILLCLADAETYE